jgi:hypothetical protein
MGPALQDILEKCDPALQDILEKRVRELGAINQTDVAKRVSEWAISCNQ